MTGRLNDYIEESKAMNKQGEASPKPTAQAGPPKMMYNQMGIYYSNCVMVTASHRDISGFFGRYVPRSDEQGNQQLAELYERQIYMAVEQAEDLARTLSHSVQMYKAKRQGSGKQKSQE